MFIAEIIMISVPFTIVYSPHIPSITNKPHASSAAELIIRVPLILSFIAALKTDLAGLCAQRCARTFKHWAQSTC